jgi:hypothetical protein
MLADRTEPEIFSLMRDKLRSATAHCKALALLPLQGPTYRLLREELKDIEELCRQAGYYRDDSRWFRIGLVWEQIHQKSREWIVAHNPRKDFLWLAERCEALDRAVDDLQHKATGKLGMILPPVPRAERTEGRPMQVLMTPGGDAVTMGGILLR